MELPRSTDFSQSADPGSGGASAMGGVAQGWTLDLSDRDIIAQLSRCQALVSAISALPLPPKDRDRFRLANREALIPAFLELGEIPPPSRPLPKPGIPPALSLLERGILDLWDSAVQVVVSNGLAAITETQLQFLAHELSTFRGIGSGVLASAAHRQRQAEREQLFQWLHQLPEDVHPLVPATIVHATLLRAGEQNWSPLVPVWMEGLVLLATASRQGLALARPTCSLANFYVARMADFQRIRQLASLQRQLTPMAQLIAAALSHRLATISGQVAQIVQATAFRDFARSWLERQPQIGPRHRERMLQCLYAVLDYGHEENDPGLPMAALKDNRHTLKQLYRRLGEAALARDLRFLQSCHLVQRNGQFLKANVPMMQEFTLSGTLGEPSAEV